ncbi:putative 2-phosphosulfolactate phosphatase [Methanobrevibacter woesei]|uniref:2-phosphosulfolactate phosphatase n=1 Tax=Methanobrevibacter woesei TaxID=190976 RepID=A0A2U1S755_9EURY|nr:2-phosphosulfolactate phosphatase [Methanobrevibacter woesei]MCC9261749.1 2-phosphosulfolactate phosphatase [Methanobrevibacter woesei]MCI7291577.1 2-phosphosulfolactate phosphatase [Methanobrevibacter woesei]PWB85808.1 putative 2-phosphosulfolactate phosphatase [Methanobrevibacter woesei]
MKITLSFEKTTTTDVSIMVDALRASSSIVLGLNNFKEIIPCFTPEEAFKLGEEYNAILAGEREGIKIKGFDIGNSPKAIETYKIPPEKKDTLILTTSNGTRILKDMKSTVLVGSIVNAEAVGKKSIEIAENEIDVVMAGYKGNFALEDFLASGEIIYWIEKELTDNSIEFEISDFAKAAILASRDYENVKKAFYNCNSGRKLKKLNSQDDVTYCVQKNISDNVAIYKNGKLKVFK